MIVCKYYRVENALVRIHSMLNVESRDIINIMSKPIHTNSKSEVPLYFWGSPIDYKNTKLSKNFGKRSAIILDYDNGYEIREWINKWGGNIGTWYLHTSFSNSELHNKFRVIIPTKSFIMTNILKRSLLSYFNEDGHLDISSFDNRGFYLPSYNDLNKMDYFYAYRECDEFDWSPIATIVDEYKKEAFTHFLEADSCYNINPGSKHYISIESRKKAYIDKCIDPIMQSINWGVDGSGREVTLFKAISMMKHMEFDGEEFDSDEIIDALEDYLIDDQHIQMLEKQA